MAFRIKATLGKGTSISHKSKAKTKTSAMQAFRRKFPKAKISSVTTLGKSKSVRKNRSGVW